MKRLESIAGGHSKVVECCRGIEDEQLLQRSSLKVRSYPPDTLAAEDLLGEVVGEGDDHAEDSNAFRS